MPARSNFIYRIIALLLTFGFIMLLPHPGSTHEPITTKVMFNKEIIRIFQRNCLGCHSPGKFKADIPLTTYEEARPWAKAIKEEILEKRMMPYQAVKGYGSFQHDYILPQRDIDLLVSWVEGGAPRGEEKDYPKDTLERLLKGTWWQQGEPDLILQPEVEAKIGAEGDDQVRCFVLPTKINEDRWIKAIDFQPGNGLVVSGASFFIDRPPQKRVIKTGNKNVHACGTMVDEGNLECLGHWVPGQAVSQLPDNAATLLPANSRILMKVHYRNSSDATTDRSRIGLYLAKDRINKAVRNIVINSPVATGTAIPANDANHRIKASQTLTESTEAVAIRPLLFPLAKSLEATAYRPDGTIEVLIWVKNYRFDWQPTYYFKKPVPLPKGTRIEITSYLDNSENNPNISDDSPKPSRFTNALCEISLIVDNR
jgi:hypothetical protein